MKNYDFPTDLHMKRYFFPKWLPMDNETVAILDRSESNFSIHRAVSAALASGRLYTFVYTYCTYIYIYIYYIYYIYMYNVSNQSHNMYICSYDST